MRAKQFVLGIFGMSFIFLALAFVSAQNYCGGFGGMMGGSYGFGTMIFGWIIAVLVIVALVLLILWLVKKLKLTK